jgi:NOL1/NOP2/fmu family ribosome biogenesis protein
MAAQSLRIIHAGIKMGTVKGKDFIPDQSLALSTALNRNAFALAELDYGQAINYLRRDSISLPQETARGFVLLTYKDAPLGFVKNIGNRVNNMYPQEWRIRTMPIAMQGKENQ